MRAAALHGAEEEGTAGGAGAASERALGTGAQAPTHLAVLLHLARALARGGHGTRAGWGAGAQGAQGRAAKRRGINDEKNILSLLSFSFGV